MSEPTPIFIITFVRHGESEGNLAGLLQGQSDLPLSENGLRQAQALGAYWKARNQVFDHVFCSPLLRARETAKAIANALNVPIDCDPAWMERDFGELEGTSLEQARRMNPPIDFYHPYQAIGGTGESGLDLFIRTSQALQKLLRRPAGRYLIVTHGAALNMLLYSILGLTPVGWHNSPRFYVSNTGFTTFSYHPDQIQWRMHTFNALPHLEAPYFDGSHLSTDKQ